MTRMTLTVRCLSLVAHAQKSMPCYTQQCWQFAQRWHSHVSARGDPARKLGSHISVAGMHPVMSTCL